MTVPDPHAPFFAERIPARPESAVPERLDGKDLCFWYASTRIAEASASCRYRIGNLVELLRGSTAVMDRELPPSSVHAKRAVIAIRPLVDAHFARMLARLRRQGIRLVADFDDLLFDCEPDHYPAILNGGRRALHERRLEQYRASLDHFDAFLVATEPLAEHLRALRNGAPVHVVPNGLSLRWVRQGQLLYEPWTPGSPKIIRYFSGSPTHDRDFLEIEEPLAAFLAEHPAVRLEVVGHLDFDRSRFPRDQINCRAHLEFEWLPELLAASWVTLAPLAQSEFNRCKSSIKFLEAAAFGCPTIASPSPDMQRHAGHGLLLAPTKNDWYAALTALLNDEHRMELGRAARAYAMAQCTAAASVAALMAARESWNP